VVKRSTRTANKAQKRRKPAPSSHEDGAALLLRAAERLFATRGVDNVSLREVAAEAGQRNNSAAAYHFGDKVGLVDAILEKHCKDIHGQYQAMLDLVENRPDTDVRRLVEVLVLPVVRKLDDADGGREFLALSAQLTVSPSIPLLDRPVASAPAAVRLMSVMVPMTELPAELMLQRMLQIPMLLYGSILSFMRLGDAAPPRELFVSDLVDAITALTTVHLPATRELVEKHRERSS
jgi:AcrR family transcriptional regulator